MMNYQCILENRIFINTIEFNKSSKQLLTQYLKEHMKFLKLQAVMAITGLSRSSIYLAINQGNFPLQIPLGVRSVVWDEREVITWMESRIALRKAA